MDTQRFGPPPTLTGPETAAAAGVDYETARRIWRALGLPEVDDDVVAFSDEDVNALKAAISVVRAGYPLEDLIDAARVYGQSMARIADAESRVFVKQLVEPLVAQGLNEEQIVDRLRPISDAQLDLAAPILDYVHRRHLAVALQEVALPVLESGGENLTAAFVDLVDFSRVSEDLLGSDLSELLTEFEDLAISTCSETGARLVKIVGDAAMIVSPIPERALEASRAIVGAAQESEILPAARAGLDSGPVMAMGGDYFGRPVNVASRITAFARPGTVVISQDLFDALAEKPDVGRVGTHRLKGVGRVTMFKVREPASADEAPADPLAASARRAIRS